MLARSSVSKCLAGEGARATLNYLNLLIHQLLVVLVATRQLEGISQRGFALFNAGDDVRAAKPVSFGEVGRRPLRRMVRVGVVEANDVLFTLAAFPLDSDQFFGIDVVAVLRRIGTRVARACEGSYYARAIAIHSTEQDAAALVRIGFLAMLA